MINQHKITARQLTRVQPMTKPIKKQHHKRFNLYDKDAHRQVGAYIDLKDLKRKNADVAKRITETRTKLKEVQRANSKLRREALPHTDPKTRPTDGLHSQLESLKLRARRLSNFTGWLRKGNEGHRAISTRDLENLINEFFSDAVTRLGSIVREE